MPIWQSLLASASRDRPHYLGGQRKKVWPVARALRGHSSSMGVRGPHPLYIPQFHSSSQLRATTLPSPRVPINSIACVLYYPSKTITLEFDTTNNGPKASFNTRRDLNPSKQTWGPWQNQKKHAKLGTPKSLRTESRPCPYIVQSPGTDRAFKHEQRDRTQHSTIQPLSLAKYTAEYFSDLIPGRQPYRTRNTNHLERSRSRIFIS